MLKISACICFLFLSCSSLLYGQSVEKLKTLIEPEHPIEKRLSAYVKLCDLLIDKDMATSLEHAQKANQLARKKEVKNELRLEVWRVYANALVRNGQVNKGLDVYKKNLRLRDSLNLTDGLGLVYRNIGAISSFLQRHSDALHYSSLALNTADVKKDTVLLATLHLNIGCIHYQLSDHDVSISHVMKSMKLARQINDTLLIADNSLQLGNLLKHVESYDEAIEYYRDALAIYEKREMYKSMTMAYHNLSIAFKEAEQYDSALVYVKKAEELWIQIGDFSTLIAGLNTEASIHHLKGNISLAIELSEKALSYSEESEEIGRRLGTLNSLCFYALESGKYQEALKWGKEAYEGVEKTKNYPLKLVATEQLAEVYEKLGNYAKAAELFRIALSHKDSVESARNAEMMMKREALYSFGEKKTEIANLKAAGKLKSIEAKYERDRAKNALLVRNVVSVSAIVVLLAFYFLFRSRQQHQRAKFSQKVSQLKMKAMQSQMNPHFIYNALNSIQGLINKNDKLGANLYLSKFAMLLRKILEFSDVKTITLGEEIETLRLYVEIEKLRFAFDYRFTIDQSVDQSAIEIPSLLFQPFIENAIHHGLRNSEKKGVLTMDMVMKGEELVCTIEDNGIGRTEAAKIGKESTTRGRSYGMQLSQERLNVLLEKFGERPIEIEDVNPATGTGTRVIIRIPLEK